MLIFFIMKELEEKILHQYGWLIVISPDQGTPMMSNNEQRDTHLGVLV